MGFFAIFKKASNVTVFFQTIEPKTLYNVEKSILTTFVKEN